MTRAVTDEAVAAYLPLVERLARNFTGYSGAEYDDLRQEGMIAVWQTLGRGLRPSITVVGGRMLDWADFLLRLKRNDAVAYEKILPIEEYGEEPW